MNPIDFAEVKRQILNQASKAPFRERVENPPGINEGEILEMGNDLDNLTRTRGWTLVESYMLRRMNLVGLVMNDNPDDNAKGVAKGFIELMQWIQLTIQARDKIIEKEKINHEAKTISQDERG